MLVQLQLKKFDKHWPKEILVECFVVYGDLCYRKYDMQERLSSWLKCFAKLWVIITVHACRTQTERQLRLGTFFLIDIYYGTK